MKGKNPDIPENDEIRIYTRKNNKLLETTFGLDIKTMLKAPIVSKLEEKQRVFAYIEAGTEEGGLPESDEVRTYTRFKDKLFKVTLTEV